MNGLPRTLARTEMRLGSECGFTGTFIPRNLTGVSCRFSLNTPIEGISFQGTVGITDLKMSNINFARGTNVGNSSTEFNMTGGVSLAAANSNSNVRGVGSPLIRKPIPIARVAAPIWYTLGLVRLDFPIALDVNLPIFGQEVGFNGTLPYKDGIKSPTGAFQFLFAQVENLTPSVRFEDAFIGLKGGPTLVQSTRPRFGLQWILGDDETIVGSEGVFVSFGGKFDVGVDLQPLCVKISGSPAYAAGADLLLRSLFNMKAFLEKEISLQIDLPPNIARTFPENCGTAPPAPPASRPILTVNSVTCTFRDHATQSHSFDLGRTAPTGIVEVTASGEVTGVVDPDAVAVDIGSIKADGSGNLSGGGLGIGLSGARWEVKVDPPSQGSNRMTWTATMRDTLAPREWWFGAANPQLTAVVFWDVTPQRRESVRLVPNRPILCTG
ncbi:hypothetical protein RY831_14795 [Noviherbaspirillum sp. CPCC 100848]|uniref:Uncharacterized protein n=1 Tax=Noviherbaspirillum album TaxID=3080276 RepID=A0ABU6J9U0_9BURK|nr:hypothetical protein [Noviherbaspirillum sp. CPCC 100848]MEC4720428.1 hypothetical protein [Noviherbaspirillum sp. CPCC 100848]